MKKYVYINSMKDSEILKRPAKQGKNLEKTVNQIFEDVLLNGDLALKKYTKKYDGVELVDLIVSNEEMVLANNKVSDELKTSIQLAIKNIEKFHKSQITKPLQVETSKGVLCWQEKRPIEKIALYIPGGTAPLFSTILMLAIPAKIAGCDEIYICTPPDKSGYINPVLLYTAQLCGVNKVYKIGGIQAIAAMTFGTKTISKVFKIFGPGNQFVTAAKQMATKYGAAIDLPAGPSELLVLADDSSIASFVAADLLSQAEHGEDSQVILVSTSKKLLEDVEIEINLQIENMPRKAIAEKAMIHSKLIYCSSEESALELINEYAPEHLIICMINENEIVHKIQSAGSVFLGNYSPESAGDYVSGTNHTLPTNGFAKNYSGVNLDSFLKTISFQKITRKGLNNIGSAIEEMAEAEGLFAHKNAVTLRLNYNKNEK